MCYLGEIGLCNHGSVVRHQLEVNMICEISHFDASGYYLVVELGTDRLSI